MVMGVELLLRLTERRITVVAIASAWLWCLVVYLSVVLSKCVGSSGNVSAAVLQTWKRAFRWLFLVRSELADLEMHREIAFMFGNELQVGLGHG